MSVFYDDNPDLLTAQHVIPLYEAHNWSAATKPRELMEALRNSHTVFTAWDGQKLVGLVNAISDGFLVVYYPHLLVLPEYQGLGIGAELMRMMAEKYKKFHQQMVVSEKETMPFYEKCGFKPTGERTSAMWIYDPGEMH